MMAIKVVAYRIVMFAIGVIGHIENSIDFPISIVSIIAKIISASKNDDIEGFEEFVRKEIIFSPPELFSMSCHLPSFRSLLIDQTAHFCGEYVCLKVYAFRMRIVCAISDAFVQPLVISPYVLGRQIILQGNLVKCSCDSSRPTGKAGVSIIATWLLSYEQNGAHRIASADVEVLFRDIAAAFLRATGDELFEVLGIRGHCYFKTVSYTIDAKR